MDPAHMHVGHESGPFFMARYDDVFHLPLEDAREQLGYAGAEFVDTTGPLMLWAERA
jgi:ubiquinone biosynthesis protein COQ4